MIRRQDGITTTWRELPPESPKVQRARLTRMIALEKKLAADIARLQKRGHVFGPPSNKRGRPILHPEGLRKLRQAILLSRVKLAKHNPKPFE
jgi:hypothetical protein